MCRASGRRQVSPGRHLRLGCGIAPVTKGPDCENIQALAQRQSRSRAFVKRVGARFGWLERLAGEGGDLIAEGCRDHSLPDRWIACRCHGSVRLAQRLEHCDRVVAIISLGCIDVGGGDGSSPPALALSRWPARTRAILSSAGVFAMSTAQALLSLVAAVLRALRSLQTLYHR